MRTLEEIDTSKKCEITPYNHDLDAPALKPVLNLSSIELTPEECLLLVDWAKQESWRPAFETDMQCIAEINGVPLLSAWMPLVTFRYQFCSGGRQMQTEAQQQLFDKLVQQTRDWRSSEVDTVDFSFFIKDKE